MQKTILGGVLILCALSAQTQTNRNTAPAIYIAAADIQATLKKAPADSVTDQAFHMAKSRPTGSSKTERKGDLAETQHRSCLAARRSSWV